MIKFDVQKNYFSIMNGWSLLEVDGPEARSFLNRMTTTNMKDLSISKMSESTLLTATGKLILYFKIYCKSENTFLLIAPPKLSKTIDTSQLVFDELEKFHFMEKFTIRQINQSNEKLNYVRIFGNELPHLNSNALRFEENFFSDKNYSSYFKNDIGLICTDSELDQFKNNNSNFLKTDSLNSLNIFFGIPQSETEIVLNTNPLEIGLDRAVHENKGCYPGQEVIERIRSMGASPKLSITLIGKGTIPTSPFSITDSHKQDVGNVTSISAHPFIESAWVAIAVIRKNFWNENSNFLINSEKTEVRLNSKLRNIEE